MRAEPCADPRVLPRQVRICPASHVARGEPILGITRTLLVDQHLRRLDWYWFDLLQGECGGAKTALTVFANFVPNPLFYVTVDPAVVRHILRDSHDNWIKSDPDLTERSMPLPGFDKLLGEGIFGVDHGKQNMHSNTLPFGGK